MRSLVLCTALLPLVVHAQPRGDRSAPPPGPRLVVEASGGAVAFGSFLEQTGPGGGERELTAAPTYVAGGALGLRPFPQTEVRLTASFSSGSLEWADDTGTDSDALDRDDVADLSLATLGLEVRRAFGPPALPVRPFLSGGVLGGVWSVDAGDGPAAVLDADDQPDGTAVRYGLTTSAGVVADLSPRVALTVEARGTGLGNPFDGADALRVAPEAGVATRDEPASTPTLEGRLALSVRL